MKSLLLLPLVTAMLLLSAGCSNALYFYETEKFSFTVEGKPDATEPVSGNLGIKQRVVLVTPARKTSETNPKLRKAKRQAEKEEVDADGLVEGLSADAAAKVKALRRQAADSEALSIISFFDLKKEKLGKWFVSDPVTIKTLFITGDATALDQKETASLVQATEGRFKEYMTNTEEQKPTLSELQAQVKTLTDAKADKVIAAITKGPAPNFEIVERDDVLPHDASLEIKKRFLNSRITAFADGTHPERLGTLTKLLTYIKAL